jgi:2-methylisocitrate lyase-like PEP mutase family enzyme
LLAQPGLLRAPGVFEGLGAHLVRRAGFSAAYLTGAGVAVSGYGLPDIGLVTGSEMVERVSLVVEASGLPVIADADTGYGNAVNVVRTVRAYERAGVAAIQLEDQAFPKRCGHLTGKELVSVDEFVRKLRAALDAREAGTIIIARTDARGPAGIEEAIIRAKRYAAEGADLIFVEAPESGDEIERVAAEVDAPLVFNVVPSGRSPESTRTTWSASGSSSRSIPVLCSARWCRPWQGRWPAWAGGLPGRSSGRAACSAS